MRQAFLYVLLSLMLLLPAVQAEAKKAKTKPKEVAAAPAPVVNHVVLRVLNKVTAHSETLEGQIGNPLRFGNLEIVALACHNAPEGENPDDAVLLDVREIHVGELPKRVFVGWMFSASPSLSPIEHRVYDISVVSCIPPKPEAPAAEKKEQGHAKP